MVWAGKVRAPVLFPFTEITVQLLRTQILHNIDMSELQRSLNVVRPRPISTPDQHDVS